MSAEDDDVAAPWWPNDVRLLTNTDLEAKRYARGNLSDPTDYAHRLVETARRCEGLNTLSATIDRGLRVELAYLIDSRGVMFTRDDYDIAYTIPPASWVAEHRFSKREVLSVGQLPDNLDPTEQTIAFTTAEVVYEMLHDAQPQTDHDTLSGVCRAGVERLIGR